MLEQKPIEGVSMLYTFGKANENAPSTHKTQYFEVAGDHAIYHDGWIASSKVVQVPWDNSGAAQTMRPFAVASQTPGSRQV